MKLYFRNSRAKFRPIANIDGRKPDKEIAKQIVAKINEFCDERNFKIITRGYGMRNAKESK